MHTSGIDLPGYHKQWSTVDYPTFTHTAAAILVDVSYCLVDRNRLTQEHNQGVDTTNLFPQYIVAAATATALVVVVVVAVLY